MSVRIWIWIAALVAIPMVAVIVITSFPRDAAEPQVSEGAAEIAAVAEENRAANQAPADVSAPLPVDETLANDIAAIASARQQSASEGNIGATDIPVQFVAATADETMLLLDYRVDIDVPNFDGPTPPKAIVPGLVAFECDDYACFEFTPDFTATVCQDAEIVALLSRGATAIFTYRDANDADIARFTVSGRDCGASGAP